MSRHWGWFWARAWALLLFAALCWAGNSVAARLAIGEVSPMTLVFARWLVIGGVLAIAIPGQVRAHLPTLWAHRWYVLGLAGFGLTGFNALLYAAAHSTSAINIVLLQSCVPALVVMGAMARGDKISGMQFVGVAVTLLGVMIVATHGDLSRLRDLSFNRGDLMMMTGCLGGAWYNLSLRKRPPIPAIVFFAGLSLGAAMTSAPLLMVEAARGQAFWPSWIGWSIIIFCALAPALGAQVFFLRAVDLIGAARAGVYTNLVPVFGAILGVIAGEIFAFYHAVGLVLVIGGIWLAERRAETPR